MLWNRRVLHDVKSITNIIGCQAVTDACIFNQGAEDFGSPEHRWVGRIGGWTPEPWDSDRKQLSQALLVALKLGVLSAIASFQII